MLKLKELRLSCIGRFVEEQTIDFTVLGSLVQVDGLRTDTGGSSGSGKSTIFNSLDFLLGLNDLSSGVLQSRYTKEGMSVTGTFDYNGKPLVITRGKGKLIVDLPGEITTGSKLAEEKIDQILGMPRDLFRKILHKRQKEGGFFLQLTPSKTFEFLTDALGLSEVRKHLETVDGKIKELSPKLDHAKYNMGTCQAGLTATQSAIQAQGTPPVSEVTQEHIISLKTLYEASLAFLEAPKAEYMIACDSLVAVKKDHTLQSQTLELQRPNLGSSVFDTKILNQAEKRIMDVQAKKASILNAERDRVDQVRSQISALKISMADLKNKISRAVQAKAEAIKVAQEIKKIRESVCPTCEQGWVTENVKAKETQLLEKIKEYKAIIQSGTEAQASLDHSQNSIQALEPALESVTPEEVASIDLEIESLYKLIQTEKVSHLAHNAAQNESNKATLASFAQKQRDLFSAQSAEINEVNLFIEQSRNQLSAAQNQVGANKLNLDTNVQRLRHHLEMIARYENSVRTLKNQEEDALRNLAGLELQVLGLNESLEIAEEAKKVIKSYLSCSFDDALESIGDMATRIIRGIPNMANATIALEGVKETKDGKVKEEVNAVISMDGEEGISIKSLSGGERSSVDLAVDLAVIDLLEAKSGTGIDLYILDEAFSGMDTVSTEMALEVLKNSNLSKRLIIVEHNPIVSQMVTNKIMVHRDGQFSRIVQ